MATSFDLDAVQAAIREAGFDGWLFYDFRGSDPIARNILAIDPMRHFSRRWYYFVPAEGEPRKLQHQIEQGSLDGLPGTHSTYLSWQSNAEGLKNLLAGAKTVCMQYSPGNQVPYVSRVDAGTIESIRALGVEVVSAADLMQRFDAVLSEEQYEGHGRTATLLCTLIHDAFARVGDILKKGGSITEAELLAWAEARLAENGLFTDHPAIVGVNEHAADPHFTVDRVNPAPIERGDLLLFDIWAKEDNKPGAIYADMTWTAFVGDDPSPKQVEAFGVICAARDAAIARADAAFKSGTDICGYELDRACRQVVIDAGYGDYFIHRTGHSIHEETHGNGANLDDLETHDTRKILPGTLFSVEPGIYLEGDFGVRTEVDVFHAGDKALVTPQPLQRELVLIDC